MYDFLTRAESVRLAIVLAWHALCFLACIVALAVSFGYVITAPFNISDADTLARVGFLFLSFIGALGSWWSAGDALHRGAWLSFKRSLFVRGKVGH